MTKLFDAKPFIIAEVGSNWTSLSDCIISISKAAKCGAHAVKFQAFNHEALYGHIIEQLPVCGETCMPHQLPLEWLPMLKEKADACGIEFMCTAFSPELVDAVDPYVSVHKIASSDMNWPQLLERVRSKGKPVILSTGASNWGDVETSLVRLGADVPLVVMYCNAAYPSREHNLFKMSALSSRMDRYRKDAAENFGDTNVRNEYPLGYSDHSLDVIYSPLSAVRHFGAICIEKHVTFIEYETPDSPHSLNADQFQMMCDYLTGKRDPYEFNPSKEEAPMFLRHNRRLIATRDISDGEKFEYGVNFGAYRALKDDSKGMTPFAWSAFEGRKASKDIKRGDGICLEDANVLIYAESE